MKLCFCTKTRLLKCCSESGEKLCFKLQRFRPSLEPGVWVSRWHRSLARSSKRVEWCGWSVLESWRAAWRVRTQAWTLQMPSGVLPRRRPLRVPPSTRVGQARTTDPWKRPGIGPTNVVAQALMWAGWSMATTYFARLVAACSCDLYKACPGDEHAIYLLDSLGAVDLDAVSRVDVSFRHFKRKRSRQNGTAMAAVTRVLRTHSVLVEQACVEPRARASGVWAELVSASSCRRSKPIRWQMPCPCCELEAAKATCDTAVRSRIGARHADEGNMHPKSAGWCASLPCSCQKSPSLATEVGRKDAEAVFENGWGEHLFESRWCFWPCHQLRREQ